MNKDKEDELLKRIGELEEENRDLQQVKNKYETCRKEWGMRQQMLFSAIADNLPGSISYLNAQSLEYEFVNKAFLQYYGLNQNQVLGKNIKEIIGSKNYEIALPYLIKVQDDQPVSYQNRFEFEQGHRWLQVNYVPLKSFEGKINAILVFSYDITETKETEQALIENEEKFRLLIEESSDPIFSFKPDGTYTYVNKAFANGVKMDQDAIIGHRIWDVFSKEEADKRYSVLKKTFDTGEEQVFEVKVPHADQNFYFITSVTPIKDKSGEVSSAICISKNISIRKRAELELQASEQSLRLANATKDKFFSIIAHDLKNPFNAIIGLSELLVGNLKVIGCDENCEIASAIHTAGDTAYRLLENLLEWSRIQTGDLAFNPEPFVLMELVDEVLALYKNAADARQISIEVSVSSKLSVHADRNMCNTILRNLLSNAIKFTEDKGSICINAIEFNDRIEVSVKDNGVGVDDETVKKLFKINEKVSTTDTQKELGTGIGLILCHEFVEKHKGKLWVESEENVGSVFTFSLPK